jgi:hypothetical protein
MIVWFQRLGPGLVLLLWAAGCATCPPPTIAGRPFLFEHDTFAFPNELTWTYAFTADGRWTGSPRKPRPEFTQHCFVVARAAKQFHLHARFEPELPPLDAAGYEDRVRRVLRTNPRQASPADQPVGMVRAAGLEPARCYPLEPESSASANSATRAP